MRMRVLEPKDPADSGYAFWWLAGGVVLNGGALGRFSSDFQALDWTLLVLSGVMIAMFGERLGYGLGYMRGKWEAEQAVKNKDQT